MTYDIMDQIKLTPICGTPRLLHETPRKNFHMKDYSYLQRDLTSCVRNEEYLIIVPA